VQLEQAPRVRLHLIERSGQPAAKRAVYLEEAKGLTAQGTTDEHGDVEFDDLTRGTYDVHLGHEYRDHFPIAKGVVVGGDLALDLPIAELATIRGRLVGPKGVSFYSTEFSTAETPRGALGNGSFRVEADGSFEIPDLPAAAVWLEADGTDSDRVSVRALARFELHSGVNEITFDVPRCGAARVRVLGPGGTPLDRFTPVELFAKRLDGPDALLIDQKRGDDGAFDFSGLPPGSYRIDARPDSLELVKRTLGVEAVKATPVEITVASGERLERDLALSVETR
jgi:hypothetical protein